MTTANKVTISRILLVPFFIVAVIYYVKTGVELYRWLAIACFAIAALSDAVDGFIARHFNQWSELGTVLDPLADKLLLVAGVVLLSLHNEPYLRPIPPWLTITILSRDVLLLLGFALIHFVAGSMKTRPHFTGKIATVLQMGAVLWVLFKLDATWQHYLCIAAGVFTGVSGLFYLADGMRQLAQHPSSSPSKKDQATPDAKSSDRHE